MNKLFVPYNIALTLKEVGFDEECFCVYYDGKYHEHGVENSFLPNKEDCSAPLYDQVINWLREKHNINLMIVGATYIEVEEDGKEGSKGGYTWCLADNNTKQVRKALWSPNIPDYYDCRDKGIEEALKLIK